MAIKALEGRTFGTPTRRPAPKQDYFAVVIDRLFDGLANQIAYLAVCGGDGRTPRGRKWYSIIGGLYYCRIEVSGKGMVLDPATGQKWVILNSAEEACRWYREVLESVSDSEMDEMIKEHLAKIPPRRRSAT